MKNKDEVKCRFAFCFPDTYEVAMSHLGMKILYGQFNNEPDVWCERVFAPDKDMEALMLENDIPLFGLESRDPIRDFDFIGGYAYCANELTNNVTVLKKNGDGSLSPLTFMYATAPDPLCVVGIEL